MNHPSAPEILTAGVGHLSDRAATYDSPTGERSLPATVIMFNAATGHNLTAEQGAIFMACLKIVRSQQGNYKADNYEDGAVYMALAGESAARDRKRAPATIGSIAEMLEATAPKQMPEAFGQRHTFDFRGSATAEPQWPASDERIDLIAQNGNDGEHYATLETKPEPAKPAPKAAPKAAQAVVLSDLERAISKAGSMVDPTGKPSWENAPYWAMWLTQDKHGVWTFWQQRPSIVGDRWVKAGGSYQAFNSGELAGRWQDSLEYGPGHFASKAKA